MLGLNRSEHRTGSVGQPEATDVDRRTNNMLRVGEIVEVDYVKAVARVEMQGGETVTDWIPWLTMRAGPADVFWWAPEPGEVVMVGSLSGELHNGFIMATAFSNGNRNAARGTVCRATFADGTQVEYDRKAHHLIVNIAAGDPKEPQTSDASESDAADGPDPDTPEITGGRLTILTEEDVHIHAQGNVIVTSGPGSIIHLNP
jgi:phage baseplate assembly protein V